MNFRALAICKDLGHKIQELQLEGKQEMKESTDAERKIGNEKMLKYKKKNFKIKEWFKNLKHGLKDFSLCWGLRIFVDGKAVITKLHLDIELLIFKPWSVVPHNVFMRS